MLLKLTSYNLSLVPRKGRVPLLLTQGGIGHIISQRSLLKCHISEESSFYVDSRNISFENIFVSSHSSEWSKNYPAMRKKSLSIPKMYFWCIFGLVWCNMIPNLYSFVKTSFICFLILSKPTIKTKNMVLGKYCNFCTFYLWIVIFFTFHLLII